MQAETTVAETLVPEVLEPVTGQELVRAGGSPGQVLSLQELLQTTAKTALEAVETTAVLLDGARKAAIKRTAPQDWILSADRQGNQTAMLQASGAKKILEVYGCIVLPAGTLFYFLAHRHLPPGMEAFKVERSQLDGGHTAWTINFDAYCKLNGRFALSSRAMRSSAEEFTGRRVDAETGVVVQTSDRKTSKVYEADLQKSTYTLMETLVARDLCGMKSVTPEELDAAWGGEAGKSTKLCKRGHGYGSSASRSAEGVAEGDVKEEAEKLKVEILRMVDGDPIEAKKVLGEITVDKDGKFAKTSIAQFTQAWQVKKAFERLLKHPRYTPAADREPGED